MAFLINTHDSWGVVTVGTFQSLEEARQAFASLCADPWYKNDGMAKGIELLEKTAGGHQRLDWFAFK